MRNLLRAEFRRVFHHRGIHILLLLSCLYYVIDVTVRATYAFNEPRDRALETFSESLSFPTSFFTAMAGSFVLLLFLWPAITAKIVGADYESDTWKMILPRTRDRGSLLAAKLMALATVLLSLFVFHFVLLNILAAIASIALDIPFMSPSVWPLAPEHKEVAVDYVAFTLWYSSVGVLFTILFRSVFTGAFATLGFYFVTSFVRMYSPESVAIFFAPSHFSNLIPQEHSGVVQGGMNRLELPVTISWLIVAAHVCGNVLIAYLVLKKQDFDAVR